MSAVSELLVRSFDDRDTDAVWELHNLALASTDAHVGNGPWDDDVRNPRSNYLERGGEFLVGFIAAELMAMGAYTPLDSRTVEIKRMRVSPRVQRKGFGTRILLELEARARRKRYVTARLDTTREQIAAQRLYLANGYQIVGNGWAGRFETIVFEKVLGERVAA